jgi:diguanylate cyclase (GGDEF)-like protein
MVTISLGIASAVPSGDCTPESLLAAADSALYAAKSAGRNRVVANSSLDT